MRIHVAHARIRRRSAWRSRVFSGASAPASYNGTWWELRRRYQGIAPPVARAKSNFSRGAKYLIPANTPHPRHILSLVLQFPFHRAACALAGRTDSLRDYFIVGAAALERYAQA
jgi:peptidyl-dipeptidase A